MPRTLSHREAASFYDRMGARQDTQAFYEDPAVDELFSHGGFDAAEEVLEIGCGTGRFAERLLEGCPRLRYTGIDVSGVMAALSRDRLARFGERARILETDGSPGLGFGEGSFDRIVATYVFDLLSEDDIARLLSEVHRVLRPSGLLCTAGLTPGPSGVSRFVTAVWTAVERSCPRLVGGCRPLRLTDSLDGDRFRVVHRMVVIAWGVPSEVLVARRADEP